MIGCYPGSFNPPTIAHLAVAEAAVRRAGLVRLDLVVSHSALGKTDPSVPALADRVRVLRTVAASRPWLGVVLTDARLISDIAQGYDVVVLGADKWAQVGDPGWYGGSSAARDAALARLPRVLVAPRAGSHPIGVELLEVPPDVGPVNATAIREGRVHAEAWILPEAVASGLWHRMEALPEVDHRNRGGFWHDLREQSPGFR